MNHKQITEALYREVIKSVPKCNFCSQYAIKRCVFSRNPDDLSGWFINASFQICEKCPVPKQEFSYINYKVWEDKEWIRLKNLLLEYESYSKLDRINKFL